VRARCFCTDPSSVHTALCMSAAGRCSSGGPVLAPAITALLWPKAADAGRCTRSAAIRVHRPSTRWAAGGPMLSIQSKVTRPSPDVLGETQQCCSPTRQTSVPRPQRSPLVGLSALRGSPPLSAADRIAAVRASSALGCAKPPCTWAIRAGTMVLPSARKAGHRRCWYASILTAAPNLM
jgi:hypothetical protein